MSDPNLDELLKLGALLKAHYGPRFARLILLEPKRPGQLELLLILHGEVNQMREILRVESLARRFSSATLEVAILPVSSASFDAAFEPELWEAQFTGTTLLEHH